MAAYLTMTAAHANNVFIATADRIGTERSSGFMGNSLIAATNGWPIGRIAGPDEDTILYADIDIMQSRTAPIWNQLNDLFRDRRTDLTTRCSDIAAAMYFRGEGRLSHRRSPLRLQSACLKIFIPLSETSPQ
jgi:hypothetical protein